MRGKAALPANRAGCGGLCRTLEIDTALVGELAMSFGRSSTPHSSGCPPLWRRFCMSKARGITVLKSMAIAFVYMADHVGS